jgi:hypothetical protein
MKVAAEVAIISRWGMRNQAQIIYAASRRHP